MKYPDFQHLTMDEHNYLIGGFSNTFGLTEHNSLDESNNCKGGNCEASCGQKSKEVKGNGLPNKNCAGNCVKGCGGNH